MSFLQRISHRSRLISADPSCLNRPRIRRRLFLIVVLFSYLFVSTSQAVLPVIVWAVARQAAVYTAQSVAIGVIAKGFSANDPYVRTTATISRTRLAQNIEAAAGGHGVWGVAPRFCFSCLIHHFALCILC